jgi:hypothetical protein
MRRGQSKQDYGTPREFLDAVGRRFGAITFDLAANATNAVAPAYFGPGSPLNEDALDELAFWPNEGVLWLNPPFADIDPSARECATWTKRGAQPPNARLLMLVPASVGSEWWHEHIRPNADVLFLSPRLTFVGTTDPYPKDLGLCIFDPMRKGLPKVQGRWRWK